MTKTSGALLLQEKKPERLIGTASAGVDDRGEAYVRIGFNPTEGVFWLCSHGALRIQRDLAIELSAFLRILAASTARLDGVDPTLPAGGGSGVGLTIRSVGPPSDGMLECNFDGVDVMALSRESDGLCVLLMPAHAAAELSDALIEELARIATWEPRQS